MIPYNVPEAREAVRQILSGDEFRRFLEDCGQCDCSPDCGRCTPQEWREIFADWASNKLEAQFEFVGESVRVTWYRPWCEVTVWVLPCDRFRLFWARLGPDRRYSAQELAEAAQSTICWSRSE